MDRGVSQATMGSRRVGHNWVTTTSKVVLGKITMNKVSESDGIPAKLFQILKDDTVKALNLKCSKFGKLMSGHRSGKSQFSFQFQQRAMPKNVQGIM